MQQQQRDIFADVAAFANRFSDPLLNALTGLVVGAVTAALTGNVIDGVKIAAAGVGKLIIEIVKTPPPSKSLGTRAKSFFQRIFSVTMLVPMLIVFLCAIAFLAAVLWAFNGQKTGDQIEQDIPHPNDPTIPDSTMPHITVHNQYDEEFEDRSFVQNKAAILAINKWADGDTLAGCDRDGANMTRRVLETWGVPEDVIAHTLERYWASENGFYARVLHNNNELRILRNNRATCARAQKALLWTTDGATDASKNFWYQSMHGTTTPSQDANEPTGIDQVSVMYDFNWNRKSTWFLDNYMDKATRDMPREASLLAMLDTCHAANFLRNVQQNGAIARFKAPPQEFFDEFMRGRSFVPRAASDDSADNVLLLAGCEADNVSYSNWYTIGGEKVMEGALTHNFLKVHAENPLASHEEIFNTLYPILAESKYVQRPQLQGSKRMRSTPFLVGA